MKAEWQKKHQLVVQQVATLPAIQQASPLMETSVYVDLAEEEEENDDDLLPTANCLFYLLI